MNDVKAFLSQYYYRDCVFYVVSKLETYNMQQRIRHQIFKMNYSIQNEDLKELVEMINLYI